MAAQPNNDDLDQLLDSTTKLFLFSLLSFSLNYLTHFNYELFHLQVLSMISTTSTSLIRGPKPSFSFFLSQRFHLSSSLSSISDFFIFMIEVKRVQSRNNNNNPLLCLLGFKDWAWAYLTSEPRRKANKSSPRTPMSPTHSISSEPKPKRPLGVSNQSPLPPNPLKTL